MSSGLGCSDLKMTELRTQRKVGKVSSRVGTDFRSMDLDLFKGIAG